MIFWSSFIKKIKQSISKEDFAKLTGRVDNNTTNIAANLEKINLISTELANANLVNYTGPYSASKTYKVGQAITYIKSPEINAKWYVSNKDRNKGNTPAGVSDEFWELISEPTINLNEYLKKTEAASIYLSKTDANSIYLTKSEANTVYLSKTDASAQYSTKSDLNNYYNKSESDTRFARLNYENTFNRIMYINNASGSNIFKFDPEAKKLSCPASYFTITDLLDPVSDYDVANKHYVDTNNTQLTNRINLINDKFGNYYTKIETYSKSEVNSLIGTPKFLIRVGSFRSGVQQIHNSVLLNGGRIWEYVIDLNSMYIRPDQFISGVFCNNTSRFLTAMFNMNGNFGVLRLVIICPNDRSDVDLSQCEFKIFYKAD